MITSPNDHDLAMFDIKHPVKLLELLSKIASSKQVCAKITKKHYKSKMMS